jgi:phosphatidylglycerophosphate synthase
MADHGPRPAPEYKQTLRHLSSAQKAVAPGAPPYSVYVNRRLGKYAAAGAYCAGLSPNSISGISAAFTFSGIAILAAGPGAWWLGIIVWAMLAVGYVLDSADGQVARLRGGGSLDGEWLDHVLDSAKVSSLHLAVLIAAYRNFNLPSDALLLVPIAFSLIAGVSFFAMILNDQLKTIQNLRAPRNIPLRNASIIRSILLIPTDYGILCILFVFIGIPSIFFTLYTLFFLANACHLTLAVRKWFRDMKRLATSDSDEYSGEAR